MLAGVMLSIRSRILSGIRGVQSSFAIPVNRA
jgi:hypothetical protein